MAGIHGATVRVAAWDRAGPLHPLLGRVVTELAEARPVRRVPEQLPCRLEPHRITTVLGVLEPGRNLVVDDCCRDGPLISRTHRAVGVLPQMSIAGLLPLVPVTALRATAATFIALTGHRQKPHARQVAWQPNAHTTRSQHLRPPLLSGIQVRQRSRSTCPPRTAA